MTDEIHQFPVNDIFLHEDSVDCLCGPEYDTIDDVYYHRPLMIMDEEWQRHA